MRALARLAAVVLAAAIGTGPVLAQAEGGDGAEAPQAPIAFRPVVEQVIDKVVVPGYRALAEAADREAASVAALCAAPTPAGLDAARGGFGTLVDAWSRVEMFRFGPARDRNRTERLFFWPDRKGLGQRQVDDLLAAADKTATDVVALREKSVAVQGLLALEYALHGEGSASLAAPPAAGFRCRYAAAVAVAVALTADEILDGWIVPGGFADTLRTAGPDNPVYRSHGEVVQELLRAAREQLQMDADLKLARVIGDTPGAAVPRRAPFWRSDRTLAAIIANIEAVAALNQALGAGLPENAAWLAGSLAFELRQAAGALGTIRAAGKAWEDAARDPASHQRLAYALIPLGSAVDMLGDAYPNALGLITGFNSQDGD